MKKTLLVSLALISFAWAWAAPVMPTLSSGSDIHWYAIRFASRGLAITDNGAGSNLTIEFFKGTDAQQWKIEDDGSGNYIATSKLGNKMNFNSGDNKFTSDAASPVSFSILASTSSYADTWVIRRVSSGNCMNQDGSDWIGHTLCEWGGTDDSHDALQFIDMTNHFPNTGKWYKIQFVDGGYYLADQGNGNTLKSKPNATDDAQLWQLEIGTTAGSYKLKSKLGNYVYSTDNMYKTSSGNSTDIYVVGTGSSDIAKINTFEMSKNSASDQGFFNLYGGGGNSNAEIGSWYYGSGNQQMIFLDATFAPLTSLINAINKYTSVAIGTSPGLCKNQSDLDAIVAAVTSAQNWKTNNPAATEADVTTQVTTLQAAFDAFLLSIVQPKISDATNEYWYALRGTRTQDKYVSSGGAATNTVYTNITIPPTDIQLWKVVSNGGGYELVNKATGEYVDADANGNLPTKSTTPTKSLSLNLSDILNFGNTLLFWVENTEADPVTGDNCSFRLHNSGGSPLNWTGNRYDDSAWKFVDVYTVKYNANGATSGTVPTDLTTYLPTTNATVKGNTGTLAKTGYAFSGWNTKADGTGTDYASSSSCTITKDNVTLYAKWMPLLPSELTITQKFVTTGGADASELMPNEVYRIRFTIKNTGGTATEVILNEEMGAGINSVGNGTIVSGSTSPGTAPGGTGLTNGWFDTDPNRANNPQNEIYPSGNSYSWDIGSLAAGATIVFDIQVQTVGTNNAAYLDNSKLSNTASLTDGSGGTTTAAALTGIFWTGTAHSVTFDALGGSTTPAPQVVSIGGTATQPTSPTKAGYTFDGWSTTSGGITAYDFSTVVTENITLYAMWSVTTGIDATNANIKVYSTNKKIVVLGANISDARAYNIAGQLVDITKPVKTGVYLVKVASKVTKVVVE